MEQEFCNRQLSYLQKDKNTGWKRIGNSDNGSFTDTTAESGISYTYTLRALDAENNLVSYCNGGKSVTYVKAPTIYKIENTATGSKISWESAAVLQNTEFIIFKTGVGKPSATLLQQASLIINSSRKQNTLIP